MSVTAFASMLYCRFRLMVDETPSWSCTVTYGPERTLPLLSDSDPFTALMELTVWLRMVNVCRVAHGAVT
ncbi:hypothetical protein [Curtobacterium aetherium]|uniref:Uncharacterized protein n=1 Tax=Curtobacterium aetherium TaxID=2841594 RepID=A0ACD1E695_9MICO|nr:hypothetical protein [Curtobacterium sp. L6-1]QWS34358.1 hypothetical protein KM842_04070 [Curtobacterium sp. L6-1]